MGVWTSPSKPGRRDLPIRLSENQLQQVYVPFVCRTDARITLRGCLAHPSPTLRDQPTLRPASYPPEWLEKELRNPFD
jgi:hypothetical protein